MLSIDFSTATVSGTFSSSTTFTPGIFFRMAARLGVRLVVAVVVARPDIDEAEDQRLLRAGRAGETEGGRARCAAEQAATADGEFVDHAVASAMVPA